ncbi:hypothetical protein ECJB195_1961 [Escherichia coli JB1-95]|nr:hypothetical protein ECJB195_1961 [Escherichia coli JB1-95]
MVTFLFIQKLVEDFRRRSAPAAISARTAADRPYLILVFMDIYQDLSATDNEPAYIRPLR